MKKIQLIVFTLFVVGSSFGQTASDYYLPFCIGNQTVLEDPGDSENWGHLATFTFLQTDIINSDVCFLQEGKLYSYSGCCLPQVFHLIWLYKDVNGDIYMKAYSEEYPVLDSAEILPTPILYFSHNYLTPAYSISQTVEPGHEVIDSVISTTAAYGGFTNCIQIRETDIVNDTITNIGDSYYAFGVGKVGELRIFPPDEPGTSTLVAAYVTSCDPLVDSIPSNVVDTCLGDYFDYYINNIQVDTNNNTVTVTWVFQDGDITNQFVETYTYQYQGNNVISITIQCSGKKSSETYYKPIWISTSALSINEANALYSINIYPNPASDFITLSIDRNYNADLTVNIYNVMGSLTRTETLKQNQQQINISDLSNGIYVVEIKSNDWTEKHKLIIQR